MKNILEADSIYRYVHSGLILSDIYLRCETGDLITISGRNGAGKSMLMKIIFGTEKAQNKHIRINHKIYRAPYEAPGLLTYLPQHPFLPAHLHLKKCSSLYLNEAEKEKFTQDEVIHRIYESRISELSSGERRYAEVRMLLLRTSKFVMLDEPLSFLEPKLKSAVLQLIHEESARKGIILTDHDQHSLKQLSSINYLLKGGSLRRNAPYF